MAMVLEGIRVLEWTQFQAGPVGVMLLGDLGADVIKIEERVGGDRGRGVFAVGEAPWLMNWDSETHISRLVIATREASLWT